MRWAAIVRPAHDNLGDRVNGLIQNRPTEIKGQGNFPGFALGFHRGVKIAQQAPPAFRPKEDYASSPLAADDARRQGLAVDHVFFLAPGHAAQAPEPKDPPQLPPGPPAAA